MPLYRPWIERRLWLLAWHLPGRRRKPVVRAGPFGRFAAAQAEPIEKAVDGAVGGLARWGFSLAARVARCARRLLVFPQAFFFKKLLQPSQLPDESGFLRARRNVRHIVDVVAFRSVAANAMVSHGAPPATKREALCLCFGSALPPAADRPTRANTSSRGPKAIERPTYSTMVMFNAAKALGRCEITMTMVCSQRSVSMAPTSAFSPSASRFALGSSSTTRKGRPNTARARPIR